MEKLNRREFLELSAKGTLASTLSGAEGIESLLKDNKVSNQNNSGNNAKSASSVISLPKGGGAVRGIGESFQANPQTGTANFSFPIATSPGRSGFGPELSLQYSSGQGNGAFGMGWGLSVPNISRKTETGIPKYQDEDVFLLSGAEDLVPVKDGLEEEAGYKIQRYQPRVEGLFARIEHWQGNNPKLQGQSFWKITTKENVTSIYGYKKQSQLFHPEDESKIFKWVLEITYDAKGNYIYYECEQDRLNDLPNSIYEAHRSGGNVVYQLYLKKVLYGNQTPYRILFPDARTNFEAILSLLQQPIEDVSHLFKVIFDYGGQGAIQDGHEFIRLSVDEYISGDLTWDKRNDPFSSYRAGFEIRTYRLCKRVLMFHQVPAFEETFSLVRSTDMHYQQNTYNGMSMLQRVVQRGYRKQKEKKNYRSEEVVLGEPGVISEYYAIKSLPPLEFGYSEFQPEQQKFKKVEATNGDAPTASLSDPNHTLVDLFGTGLPDVLHTTPNAYYYWKNLGEGKLSNRKVLKNAPVGITLDQAGVGFGDMAGDGIADLLVHQGRKWGFWEADQAGGWKQFKAYKQYPSFQLNDPNVQLVDLTGDGKSDVLYTDRRSFAFFSCAGENGFDPPKYAPRKYDLAEFPDVYFNDSRVRIADMSGDGLSDIVIVHSNRVDYYPNLGYGKFGKRITMKNAPRIDTKIDPSRLFFMDIDGSGPADLVYVESGKVRFWFNNSGNAWGPEYVIEGTPTVSQVSTISPSDFLGSGCSGLLYTAPFRGQNDHYRFLDFCGGIKPNVLVEMNNNLGATTKVQYKPANHYYIKSLSKGATMKWITTLPIPVQVVELVEKIDHISKTKLVTRYDYYHGYYDGAEREFRGFARVDQTDTESFDNFNEFHLHQEGSNISNNLKRYHVPPVLTKTWYHTGALDGNKFPGNWCCNAEGLTIDIHERLKAEYYQADQDAFDLPAAALENPDRSFDRTSLREAYRVLRGQMLRQEVYALDGHEVLGSHPYVVKHNNYQVRLIQEKGERKQAVYQLLPYENLSYHYERKNDNPRITHGITLGVDEYGNVTDQINIGYPARKPEHEEQAQLYITYQRSKFTNADTGEAYYPSLSYEQQSFEICGYTYEGQKINRAAAIEMPSDDTYPIQLYHWEKDGTKAKRIIEWQKSYFKKDEAAAELDISILNGIPTRSLANRLPLGTVESLALLYESYEAVFTNEMIDLLFGQFNGGSRVNERMLLEAGYVLSDGHWWIPSGQQAFEAEGFFQAVEATDALGSNSILNYDDSWYYFVESSVDALGNITRAEYDSISLQPKLVIDPNEVQSMVGFDALGLVVGSSLWGKQKNINGTAELVGDPMEKFEAVLDYQFIINHFERPTESTAKDALQDATTCMLYDLWRNKSLGKEQPVAVCTINRTEHTENIRKQDAGQIQQSFLYSDGLGRELQTKLQAEPDENGNARWLGSGWKIYNNKGKEVERYEPFFSNTPQFEFERQLGVSPTIFYDPLERGIATFHPNGTYEKVVFDAWSQTMWDVNDTVLKKPKDDEDIGSTVEGFLEYQNAKTGTSFKTWYEQIIPDSDNNKPNYSSLNTSAKEKAALQTETHAGTPGTEYMDTLGRTFLTLEQNGPLEEDFFYTHVRLDIEGNELAITDPRLINAFKQQYNMLREALVVDSKDAGEKYTFYDVLGNPVHHWDANLNHTHTLYDSLHRPTHFWVEQYENNSGGLSLVRRFLAERMIYGEAIEEDIRLDNELEITVLNLKGQLVFHFDGAGLQVNHGFDSKGNVLESSRYLLTDKKQKTAPSWTVIAQFGVDEVFTSASNLLQANAYHNLAYFDALMRMRVSASPDSSLQYFEYNDRNLLQRVEADLNSNDVRQDLGSIRREIFKNNKSNQTVPFVDFISYNAKGQREIFRYGNRVKRQYAYDPDTFRLESLVSRKGDGTLLQDLSYTYDPVGNITQISDRHFATVFNHQERILPNSSYTYDPLYRLVKASGREHEAMTNCHFSTQDKKHTEIIIFKPQPVENGRALRNYTQHFKYDKAGNLEQLEHRARNGNWTRTNEVAADSNRLLSSSLGSNCSNLGAQIEYDANGNTLRMHHLNEMEWDHNDRLLSVLPHNMETFYQYDAGGQRLRKYLQKQNAVEERLYFGNYEVFQEYENENSDSTFIRKTIHIMDDTTKVALVELRIRDTRGKEQGRGIAAKRIRLQIDNHLGSSTVEVDGREAAELITYEEYYAYGGTAYLAAKNQIEAKRKRYRYSSKERDDETGLYYYGARYLAPWMGRWVSSDPLGQKEGLNLFLFVNSNPIRLKDPNGMQTDETNISPTTTSNDTFDFQDFDSETQEKIFEQQRQDRINEIKSFFNSLKNVRNPGRITMKAAQNIAELRDELNMLQGTSGKYRQSSISAYNGKGFRVMTPKEENEARREEVMMFLDLVTSGFSFATKIARASAKSGLRKGFTPLPQKKLGPIRAKIEAKNGRWWRSRGSRNYSDETLQNTEVHDVIKELDKPFQDAIGGRPVDSYYGEHILAHGDRYELNKYAFALEKQLGRPITKEDLISSIKHVDVISLKGTRKGASVPLCTRCNMMYQEITKSKGVVGAQKEQLNKALTNPNYDWSTW